MLAKRIIPCLDVTGGRVVKGVNFVELRDAGDPVEIARRYDEQDADLDRLREGAERRQRKHRHECGRGGRMPACELHRAFSTTAGGRLCG